MIVNLIPSTGNSSKFQVIAKQGEFIVALSFTLRTKIWKLSDSEMELAAAKELAEAIISRHDPTMPLRPVYVFAEHNCQPTLASTVQRIRKQGMDY